MTKVTFKFSRKLRLVVASLALFSSPVVISAESGEDLYKTYCWQCHGMLANGMGANIHDMSVLPRYHTDGKEMRARSDEELFKAIKDGGQAIDKSVLMPPWGGVLSDEDIQSLVRYLRELCKCGK